MKFIPAKLPGVFVIEPDVFKDGRGFFLESHNQKKYEAGGVPAVFVQDNHSSSVKGTLRGLHLQRRHPQGKLVRVLRGVIADVVADVNPKSKTFRQWEIFNLSSENFKQVYIPPGYAHGFVVVSDHAEVEYKCTDFYHKEDEVSIIWNDPDLAIAWPEKNPILSEKDGQAPLLKDALRLL